MTISELVLALAVLLLTPGPTNTLMLLAGAERGWRRALWLIPVELGAYLTVILPLALAAGALADRLEVLRPAVAFGAALWVLYLAWTMWRMVPAMGQAPTVTARRLAVTTMLNPKGLVMGLVLVPAAGVGGLQVGILAGCIVVAAAIWAGMGARLPRGAEGAGLPPLLRRVAAVWLAGLSAFIVAGAMAA